MQRAGNRLPMVFNMVSDPVASGIVSNLAFALLGLMQVMAVALVPISLMLSTIFYVSLYFTFADCFVDDADVEPSTLS